MTAPNITSLIDRLNRPPAPAWRPEPGDVIAGQIVDTDIANNGYGDYPVITVATDTGEFAVHAFRTVLRDELAKQNAEVGDLVAIRYDGKPEGKNYLRYRVKVQKQPGAAVPPRAEPVEEMF